ncbi:unnamed protein product [Protopolystoma xenopodis]|uniref:Uncharacterized protein n=1 Tax=Protopolystoma xenopodis TaxID=117903 RepID=A0A3S5AZD2_9PLAT|nr:unnamed protein product [Protopolystoma xenopodis]
MAFFSFKGYSLESRLHFRMHAAHALLYPENQEPSVRTHFISGSCTPAQMASPSVSPSSSSTHNSILHIEGGGQSISSSPTTSFLYQTQSYDFNNSSAKPTSQSYSHSFPSFLRLSWLGGKSPTSEQHLLPTLQIDSQISPHSPSSSMASQMLQSPVQPEKTGTTSTSSSNQIVRQHKPPTSLETNPASNSRRGYSRLGRASIGGGGLFDADEEDDDDEELKNQG